MLKIWGRISGWHAIPVTPNYDKFVVDGEARTEADESYTSHNTERLDVEGTIKKIMTAEYVQKALAGEL